MAKGRIVQVRKIDLDTCGAAFMLGVSRADKVEILPSGRAIEADLSNPDILCIKVGISGRDSKGCFDPCDGKKNLYGGNISATLRVYDLWELFGVAVESVAEDGIPVEENWSPECTEFWKMMLKERRWKIPGREDERRIFRSLLSEHIDRIDVQGPEIIGEVLRLAGISQKEVFPTVSDMISGILLTEKDPVEALFRGIEFLSFLEREWIEDEWEPQRAKIPREEYYQLFYPERRTTGGARHQLPPQTESLIDQAVDKVLHDFGIVVDPNLEDTGKTVLLWGPCPISAEWLQYLISPQEPSAMG